MPDPKPQVRNSCSECKEEIFNEMEIGSKVAELNWIDDGLSLTCGYLIRDS